MNSRITFKIDADIAKIDEVVERFNKIWGIASARTHANELFVVGISKDSTDYAQAVINSEFKGVPMTYKRPAKKLVKTNK